MAVLRQSHKIFELRSDPTSHQPESLSGLIERVTFFNEENGFAVLKVKARGHRDQVTVIGSLPSVSAGEWLTAEGRWIQDREFGLQFKAEMLNSTAPTTKEGIEKYLGSGMVKGIGPIYAKKLVATFGEQIFDVIETQSARLEDVEGIGPKRRKRIKDAWAEQKVIRQIMVFLLSQGVSTSRAVRIYKTYGEDAVEKVRANPYALAKDIHGIGFKTADQIAQRIGIPHDSLIRACAGLSHVLLEATGNGHCALPLESLKDEAGKLLLVDEKIVIAALEKTHADGDLVMEKINDQELVFLPSLKRAEEGIAARIKNLCAVPSAYPPMDFDKAVEWCQGKTGKELAPSQREALKQALTSRALVITGGPGVGKTTLVNAILKILTAKKVRCLLCAPTGRAANRLADATGIEAKTIHRLLEVQPARAPSPGTTAIHHGLGRTIHAHPHAFDLAFLNPFAERRAGHPHHPQSRIHGSGPRRPPFHRQPHVRGLLRADPVERKRTQQTHDAVGHALGNLRQAEMLRVIRVRQPIDAPARPLHHALPMQTAQVFGMNPRRQQVFHPQDRLLPRQLQQAGGFGRLRGHV